MGMESLSEDFADIHEGPYKEFLTWIESIPCCNPWFMSLALNYIKVNLLNAFVKEQSIGSFLG